MALSRAVQGKEEWLELAEAAQLLGVHPSTLRRWADTGKIPFMRTLSGRRRFSYAALKQASKEMQPSRTHADRGQFEAQVVDHARQQASHISHHQDAWYTQLNEDQRLLFRYSGQRLMGVMMQFISRSDPAETFLDEGRRIAADYGRICHKAGLSVAETAQAFMFFRRSILESVQATSGLNGPDDEDGRRVFLRTIDFFDALLVATLDSHAMQ